MNKFVKPALAGLVFVVCGVIYSCTGALDEDVLKSEETENAIESISLEHSSGGEKIYVYICGEVSEAGVYELEYGSRLYELIELAGGMTDEASADGINLAEVLYDSQMVRIPSFDESQVFYSAQENQNSGLVDINTADKEALMTLPGIGSVRAEAIISYREENGGFLSAGDIMQVPGIKESLYEKIKDLIIVR